MPKEIPESMKTPIVLDGKDKLTRLLIHHFRKRYSHEKSTVVNCLREKYAMIGLRQAFSSVVARYQECRICKSKL